MENLIKVERSEKELGRYVLDQPIAYDYPCPKTAVQMICGSSETPTNVRVWLEVFLEDIDMDFAAGGITKEKLKELIRAAMQKMEDSLNAF